MKRYVWSRPSVGSRGQVVGIRLAGYLKYHHLKGLRHVLSRGEPLSLRPALHHRLSIFGTISRQFRYVVEGIKYQERVLQFPGCVLAEISVLQQLDQRFDVVAAMHVSQ